jgi:molybdate-binding protein
VRKRDVRRAQILGYSAITLAAIAGVAILASGETGLGIIVIVFALLLGLAFVRLQRYVKRDVDVV